ncbi:MAG: hypothetical protein AUK34_01125 [Ignavibacteria bacterium CG2_30_36_16]|nr:hypothetical protein [Ignavibacteria bacterium]OIP63683.1 MAG: hypothetical protein AUK34_01125 [Ignavibacteria bacterium CG2_30_36_16]PJB00930.1 MAG: hypothetical protein CO127_06440 [Ignavibacteria bacterium CG_4_9_14_3_um_filter_36_18]
MTTTSNINEIIKANAKQAKILFDLCEKNNEGVYNKLHIIENSKFPDEKKEYRVYHADGYCFDVTKEKIELAEDEICYSCIGGYEYSFNEGAYEGFKEITVEEAIKSLKEI